MQSKTQISKVKVRTDDLGNVIQQGNNPEYGYITLEQDRVTVGNNGWVKRSELSTILQGTMDDLQSLDYNAESALPGKIVVREQLEPFNLNDPDRNIKRAGKDGIICCVDGQPIYRKTFYVLDSSAEDVLIAHDNSQAIKEANGTVEAKPSAKIDKHITPEEFNGEETVEDIEEEEVEMEAESFEL
jgi:hypothetical protein